MTKENTDLDCCKGSLIRDMFLDTADETYVVARWCYFNRLIIPFYWNALHAVEKYLKAVLLLNEQSAITNVDGNRFSHNIERLYDAVRRVAGEFLPEKLSKPEELGNVDWRNESIADFVRRLNGLGDPNNRYNVYGFVQNPEDLYKLDQVVVCHRRVAVRLDGYAFLGTHQRNGGPNLSNADLLRKKPDVIRNSGRLKELTEGTALTDTRFAGLEHNFALADASYEHNTQQYGWSSHNPVLYRYILEPAETAQKPDTLAADFGEWVVSNVYLPSEEEKQIRRAIDALRKGEALKAR